MAGAISGTAITNSPKLKHKLDTVTLTINCLCNYKCPHCYLDYTSSKKYINDKTIERLFLLDFKHLSIVGKEPFADKKSISISERLIELCYENGRTISFVTNGSNMNLLQYSDLKKIKFIDVSFDGGVNSYEQYRRGDINKILENIDLLRKNSLNEINALHVLSEKTIPFLSDMVELNHYSCFDKMMFSPYIDTNSFNNRIEKRLPLKFLLRILKENEKFMESPNAFLLLDKYNFCLENDLTIDDVESHINDLGLIQKVLLIKEDPIVYGFVRVTYNGFVLTPTDSLNTVEYDIKQISLEEFSNDVFQEMIFAEKEMEVVV